MEEMINVVVIGGLHHNTLGVIRSIGERGIPQRCITVLLIGHNIVKDNYIAKSRYVNKNLISYVLTDDEIIDWLIALSKDKKERTIICCSDGSAETIMKNKHILSRWYKTPSVSYDVGFLMEKQTQSSIAIQCGMNVLESRTLTLDNVNDWTLFPCIIKPAKSVLGGGKSDIRIVNNSEELKTAVSESSAQVFQVQKYITSKKMEYQLIGCSLDSGDVIVLPGFTQILRQPPNTNTGYLCYKPIDNLSFDYLHIRHFIKKIGYSGLFSMEFIRDNDDVDYFLEINLRNDGNAYCVNSAGINLPYIWCYYNTIGHMPKSEKLTFTRPVFFIPDYADLKRGIAEVGFLRWLFEFIGAKSHAVFSLKDLGPFILQSREKFVAHLDRKKYRHKI